MKIKYIPPLFHKDLYVLYFNRVYILDAPCFSLYTQVLLPAGGYIDETKWVNSNTRIAYPCNKRRFPPPFVLTWRMYDKIMEDNGGPKRFEVQYLELDIGYCYGCPIDASGNFIFNIDLQEPFDDANAVQVQ